MPHCSHSGEIKIEQGKAVRNAAIAIFIASYLISFLAHSDRASNMPLYSVGFLPDRFIFTIVVPILCGMFAYRFTRKRLTCCECGVSWDRQ